MASFHPRSIGCFPASRRYQSASRRMRASDESPAGYVRVCALLLGLSVILPPTAESAQKRATHKKSARQGRIGGAPRAGAPRCRRRPRLFRRQHPRPGKHASRAPGRPRGPAKFQRMAALRSLQDAMTPRYKTDANGERVPDIRAAAAIIFNPANGQVLWQENAQDQRSIASITKVMTAVVFLEDNPDLDQVVTVERGDVYAASTTYLKANDRLKLERRAAPDADCVRQRRRPRARPRLARRHGLVRRADEREGARARAREHDLRRSRRDSIRPTCRPPTTSRGSSRLPRPTSGSRRSCGRRPTPSRPTAGRSASTAPTAS